MALDKQVKQAFFTLVERENGNLRQLALKRGVAYPIVHKLKNGKSSFAKMSIQTLEKLFPSLQISLFGEASRAVMDKKASKEADAELRIEYEKYISDLQKAKQELEKDRQLFELEKENWRLKREIEEIGKNEGVPDLLRR